MDRVRRLNPVVLAIGVFALSCSLLLHNLRLGRQLARDAEMEHTARAVFALARHHLEATQHCLQTLAGLLTTAPDGERTRSFTLYAPVVMGLDHHLEAIAYADPEGLVQETVGRGWFPLKTSLREHPVYRQAVETYRPAWSGPTPNVTSEGYHLTLFVVIPEGETPDLTPVALLAGRVDLNSLLDAVLPEVPDDMAVGVEVGGFGLAGGPEGTGAFHAELLGNRWSLYLRPVPGEPKLERADFIPSIAGGLALSVLSYLILRKAGATRERDSLFRLLAENAQDIVYRMRLHPTVAFEYISPASTAITGYSPQEYYADPLLALRIAAPEHRETVEQMYRGAYDFDKPLVTRRIRKDGREVWLEQRMTPFYDEQGRLVALEGIVRDITERKLLEEQLKHLSLHDALTGLYNRAYLDEELGRLEKGREYPITLLSLDVNGLKFVNDTMGHAAGDQLLRAVAEVLRASFRGGDVVARVGGDEFAAVLPRTDADAGERLVARLRARIEEYNAGSPPVPISVSLGMATASEPGTRLEPLLGRADREMYQDKLAHQASSQRGMVDALLVSLGARDGAGEGHLARVEDLVVRVGRALGLRHRELAELRLLAQVHDLGKVAVPDSILFKPGRLTPEERAAVEDHAVAGHRIATASPQLAHVAEFILHHHEWWNGRGYPCGLRGEDIPLACRIVAIVDAYDAMTSERPYRKAMSHAEAVRELRRCAGTQFDPSLVELFIGIVGE